MSSSEDVYRQITVKIIEEQEGIIGPIALEQAQKVPGLILHWDRHEVELQGDQRIIIDRLVDQYKLLFGQASVEVCREAARNLLSDIPPNERPTLLS